MLKILLLSVLAVAMIGLMVPSVYATQFPSYDFEMDIHETWSSEEVDVKLEIQKGVITDFPSMLFSNPEKTIRIYVIPNGFYSFSSGYHSGGSGGPTNTPTEIIDLCKNNLGQGYFCDSISHSQKYGSKKSSWKESQGWQYRYDFPDVAVKMPTRLVGDPTVKTTEIISLYVEAKDSLTYWNIIAVADEAFVNEQNISIRNMLLSFKPYFKSVEINEELLNVLPKHNELKYNCWYGPCEFFVSNNNPPKAAIDNMVEGFEYGIRVKYIQKNTNEIEELFPLKHGICVTETQSPDGTITKHSCPDHDKPFKVNFNLLVLKFDSLESIVNAIGSTNVDYYRTSDTFAKCSFQNNSGSRVDSTGGVKVEGDYVCIADNTYLVRANISTHVYGPLYEQTENIAYAYTSNVANHVIENLEEQIQQSQTKIPSWIKNNAGWWAEGQIDDNSFVQGIEYLVKVGIIKVN